VRTDTPGAAADLSRRLDDAVQRLAALAEPQLVILFGSHAEGRAREDSDVDLLVVASTDERIRLAARLHEALEPIMAPLAFDLVVCTPEGWERGRKVRGLVTYDADQKGVRLYAAA